MKDKEWKDKKKRGKNNEIREEEAKEKRRRGRKNE